jgi:signal transduction histidine kinase
VAWASPHREPTGESESADRDDAHRLREHNEALVRSHLERDVVLGMVAHDLRNSLGMVLGYASLLRGPTAVEDVQRFASRIVRAARAIDSLVDDLRDVSTTPGAAGLKLEHVALDGLAREVLEDLDVVARAKRITVELRAHPMPEALVDRGRFARVLVNLVGNALKYSNAGSRVIVTIQADGEQAQVVVEDAGIGMGPELVSRLFAPYESGQRTGTAGERSIGLGLFIVRCIVEAHGGSITVVSEPNVGSTFVVSIPLVPG